MTQFELVSDEYKDLNLLPTRSTRNSAGYDLRARESAIIPPGRVALIKTGVTLNMKYYQEAQVRPRSGLALKYGVTVLNAPGTIDADYYPNEIGVILHNTSDKDFFVGVEDRIAQIVISTYDVVDDDSASEGRKGGFGSTGV